MGTQFIFCVETNKQCKSDQIYIRDTIEGFYSYDNAMVKFSFALGKTFLIHNKYWFI